MLSPVKQADHWRVKIAWPGQVARFFGRFDTEAEAERWIEEHRWLTEQRQEPDAVEPDADDPHTTNDVNNRSC
jgi:hypothetical protein